MGNSLFRQLLSEQIMATLKEVAEMAGVSASTVSYVLNGKKKVRPETLKRIEDAIEALDYCPNLLASSLKTNQTKTIGVVVSDLKNLFIIDVLNSIEKELSKNGYCMIVCNSDNNAQIEKKCLRGLLSRNIDGLILIGTGDGDLSNYRNIRMPLVCMDRLSDRKFFTIRVDHVLGGRLATEYLIKRGYRKILFLGCSNFKFSQERYHGYEQAMQGHGLDDYIWNIDLSAWDIETVCSKIEELILKRVQFDAIFGCLDYIAIGAIKALLRSGKSVPEDVGVIGYDDIAPACLTYPGLTTVAQPKEKMGILAVRCLLDMICGKKLEGYQKFLEPQIVERESC